MTRRFKKEQLKGAVINYGYETIRIGDKADGKLNYYYTVL